MKYIIEMDNEEKAAKIVEALKIFGFNVYEMSDFGGYDGSDTEDDDEDENDLEDNDEDEDLKDELESINKLLNCLRNIEQRKSSIPDITKAIIEFYKSEGIEDGSPSNAVLAFTCLSAMMRYSTMTGSSIRHFIRKVNTKRFLVIKATSNNDDSFALATIDPHAFDAEIALNRNGRVYMLSRMYLERDRHMMKVTSDVFHDEHSVEVTMMRSAIKNAAERFFN